MNNVKTIITGLVTGAVASAATALVIAKATGTKPPPRCEATGTKLPLGECALVTRLSAAEAEHRAALAELQRRATILEEAVRITAGDRFYCAGDAERKAGECFRTIDACVAARGAAPLCWPQAEAVCFATVAGPERCANNTAGCVALATADGVTGEPRAACKRATIAPLEAAPPAPATPVRGP